jgi:peptide/nickel transport system ATP-binding protein
VITVSKLSKQFVVKEKVGLRNKRSLFSAVTNIDLTWNRDECIAIVGESGCGKSTLGRMLAGLIKPTSGQFKITDLEEEQTLFLNRKKMARIVQLIPQDPYAALNPVRTIRSMLVDPLRYHRMVERHEILDKIRELLELVGLSADRVLDKYPNQLSGGQRQRIVIARALTLDPRYLVADESVSMVDVSLRLTILDEMKEISRKRQLGLMFITHDFRVARYIAQDGWIAVMYLGRFVEIGLTEEVLHHPQHPYTQSLITAVPTLRGKEIQIDQVWPKSYELVVGLDAIGCAFALRCPFAEAICEKERPTLRMVDALSRHEVACHFATPRSIIAEIQEENLG